MTTKTIKRTIEETVENGETVTQVLEKTLVFNNENGEQIGSLNVNKYNGHFSIQTGLSDVDAVADAIASALAGEEVTV